ncbi:MAG: AmmeMemoRadiSam system protein A [Rhodocyclaceae bacterium]|nr:AmmeMemoRadiSam system protein A [Rhodocyclaceae bacterium]
MPLGEVLLNRARHAIATKLGQPVLSEPSHPALSGLGATFVTLTQQGKLRGCIGSLEAHRPLGEDVRANAQAAAFRDPRFPPLTAEELPHTRVEVSLLSSSTPMTYTNEEDAIRQLRPHIDGVILQWQGQRGTFLPQVWESLPEPHLFMSHLKQKAGLPGNFWASDVQLFRYEVQKWKEP